MQINIEKIKSLRAQKAWSQSHLAKVSGLSLRTIQRIEKTGTASLESAKSLASVFEMDVQEIHHSTSKTSQRLKTKLAAVIGIASLAVSGFFAVSVTAKPVMVNLNLKSSGQIISDVQLLNEEDSVSEMQITDNMKISLVSSIEDNEMIKISTKIFDLSNGKEKLIASPSIITKHQVKAEINFGRYELSLTPNL